MSARAKPQINFDRLPQHLKEQLRPHESDIHFLMAAPYRACIRGRSSSAENCALGIEHWSDPGSDAEQRILLGIVLLSVASRNSTRSHHAVPSSMRVDVDAELVECAHRDVMDHVIECLRMVVKGWHGRNDHDAHPG